MIDPYIKAMFGEHAVRAAFNYVVQPTGQDNRAAIIGNTVFAQEMSFGGASHGIHTLVLCDVVIRPHLVIASNHMAGRGASGILTSSDMASPEEWLAKGKIIHDLMPR